MSASLPSHCELFDLKASPTLAVEEQTWTLLSLLREQLTHARRVSSISKRRVKADATEDFAARESCIELQREALEDYVLIERDRIACVTEIGQIVGVEQPASLRLAQIVLWVSPELRDELLEIREELRDVADDLESLRAWGFSLEHYSSGRLTVYVDPSIAADAERRRIIDEIEKGVRRRDAIAQQSEETPQVRQQPDDRRERRRSGGSGGSGGYRDDA